MAMSSVSVAEANIATFRRAIEEGWNKGNLEAIDELFVPDFVEHQVGFGPGRDAVKGSIRSLRIAFPDLHLTFEDVVAEGDMVWARLSGAGTHEGPFMGLPRDRSPNARRCHRHRPRGRRPTGRALGRRRPAQRRPADRARPRRVTLIRGRHWVRHRSKRTKRAPSAPVSR